MGPSWRFIGSLFCRNFYIFVDSIFIFSAISLRVSILLLSISFSVFLFSSFVLASSSTNYSLLPKKGFFLSFHCSFSSHHSNSPSANLGNISNSREPSSSFFPKYPFTKASISRTIRLSGSERLRPLEKG